jgi:GNAT superfamily N-acetyltransferase
MNIDIFVADYADARHAAEIAGLLDAYASDPMGGGTPLDASVRANLAAELAKRPNAFSVLCRVDGQPAGLANCFENFSTFQCKPLVNIHDVVVLKAFRGLGLSQKMLAKVEEIARGRGCCKLTLEVLEGNGPARSAYAKFGFAGYELDPAMGKALFFEKPL